MFEVTKPQSGPALYMMLSSITRLEMGGATSGLVVTPDDVTMTTRKIRQKTTPTSTAQSQSASRRFSSKETGVR